MNPGQTGRTYLSPLGSTRLRPVCSGVVALICVPKLERILPPASSMARRNPSDSPLAGAPRRVLGLFDKALLQGPALREVAADERWKSLGRWPTRPKLGIRGTICPNRGTVDAKYSSFP